MLKGHVASEIMSRDCQMVSSDITLERLVNENILASGRRCFPVVSEGRVEGMITLRDIQKVPRHEWNHKLVWDAMTPLNKLKAIKPDEDLNTVLNTLSQNDINQLPVVEGNTVVGMVARDNIINFINVRAQLNKQ
jgi:CBS domain-containing protein